MAKGSLGTFEDQIKGVFGGTASQRAANSINKSRAVNSRDQERSAINDAMRSLSRKQAKQHRG